MIWSLLAILADPQDYAITVRGGEIHLELIAQLPEGAKLFDIEQERVRRNGKPGA